MPKIPPSLAKLPPSPPPSPADLRPPQPSPEAAVAPPPLAPSGLARTFKGLNLRPEWAKGQGSKRKKLLHSNEAQLAIASVAQGADVQPEPTPATSPPAPAVPTRLRAQIPLRKQRVYVSKHGEWGDSLNPTRRYPLYGKKEKIQARRCLYKPLYDREENLQKVVCRHFSMAYFTYPKRSKSDFLEKITKDRYSVDAHFKDDVMKILENCVDDLYNTDKAEYPCGVVSDKNFGLYIEREIKSHLIQPTPELLVDFCNDNKIGVEIIIFTDNHAIAGMVQRKRDADGSERICIAVYDPNSTKTQKRIEYDASDSLVGLRFSDFIGTNDIKKIGGDHFFIAANKKLTADRRSQTAEYTGDIDKSLLKMALAFDQKIVFEKIRAELLECQKDKAYFLDFLDTPVYVTKLDLLVKYIDFLLELTHEKITCNDAVDLLRKKNRHVNVNGSIAHPLLCSALETSNPEGVAVIGSAAVRLLQNGASQQKIVDLLKAQSAEGISGLAYACQAPDMGKNITAYFKILGDALAAGLDKACLVGMLSGTLDGALYVGNAAAIKTYTDGLKELVDAGILNNKEALECLLPDKFEDFTYDFSIPSSIKYSNSSKAEFHPDAVVELLESVRYFGMDVSDARHAHIKSAMLQAVLYHDPYPNNSEGVIAFEKAIEKMVSYGLTKKNDIFEIPLKIKKNLSDAGKFGQIPKELLELIVRFNIMNGESKTALTEDLFHGGYAHALIEGALEKNQVSLINIAIEVIKEFDIEPEVLVTALFRLINSAKVRAENSAAGRIRMEASAKPGEDGRGFSGRPPVQLLTAVSEAEAPLDLFGKSAPLAEHAFEALRALERFMQVQELKANARIGPRPLF
jgi:hypothetical protein